MTSEERSQRGLSADSTQMLACIAARTSTRACTESNRDRLELKQMLGNVALELEEEEEELNKTTIQREKKQMKRAEKQNRVRQADGQLVL